MRRVSLLVLTAFVAASVLVPTPAQAAATHDQTVYAFGSAGFKGSTQGFPIARPIVAIANTANGSGYWLVGGDGGVISFGAPFYGSLAAFHLSADIVNMAPTPSGKGYWLVGADGYVYPFGDAVWYGGMNKVRLNAPIVAIIPGPAGHGYWLYAKDGGVFAFGSAHFHGSTGAMRLRAPVVGMASTPSGSGYWLVASDGGVFTFGGATYHGSMGGKKLHAAVVGMARDGSGKGYWLAGADGGVFTFGDAQYKGSAVGLVPGDKHIVQLAGMPNGDGYRMLAVPNIPDVAQVALGARGAAVSNLQFRLLSLGYWLPGVNGVYDSLTQQAVWAFQKWQGLPRTGNVDAATQVAFRTAQRPKPRSTSGYMFEVNKSKQVMMIASNGYARWTFNISSGSDHPYCDNGNCGNAHTPEGVFSVVSQINGADNAPLGLLWRPKFFTFQGHAIHGNGSVPPYPASHGCVRVSNTAMNWIWDTNALPLGTTVWVYV